MYKFFFKRFFDLVISLSILLILLPFLIMLTVWLHYANKGAGVFFFQERPGLNERIFEVIKYKTMTDERDENGELLPDEKRLTKVGKFIRSTSIDELPQLINVLKGDMSLVGPRPLLVDFLPYYSPKHKRRHDVRPGITGWAQINGRNLQLYSKKFDYDVWYVDNYSLVIDCKVLFRTVLKVFKRDDVGNGGANTEEVDDLGFDNKIKQAKILKNG